MRTSEVLNKAADLIEQRGWGTGIESWGTSGNLCIEGGIIAAAGLDPDQAIGNLHNLCPAYRAVMQHIGEANIEPRLWMWNDALDEYSMYSRTAAEVIEVLRATAVIEAAREDAALPVEVSA